MKFRITGLFTGSKFLGEFEAESEDEAIEMASDSEANSVCLCHYCSDQLELDEMSAQTFVTEEVK